ncbi:MAG TPA: amino acid adenylation domain-containing protein [Chitinophaga sp.]|uniref:non-ribosomal peptide synthetase n=1 Tax=Chitinophaga sp. TaxID=1869181 RepID=UPI002C3CC216|nr:non-ribosomal peptide synthetase [Chitinophaga sp.]HVI44931.1 amino acid adenylation domain-containing protein [Chitinophaga sp.]
MQKRIPATDERSLETEALAADFWLTHTSGNINRYDFQELASAGLPEAPAVATVVCPLDEQHCREIRRLCNQSDILVYNFYATIFSLLLNRYFNHTEIIFLANAGTPEGYIIFSSPVNTSASFKEIFAANKNFILQAIPYAAGYNDIAAFIGEEKLAALTTTGLAVNTPADRMDGYDPLFSFIVTENVTTPSIQVTYPGDYCSNEWMTLFLDNFRHLAGEIIAHIYEPVSTLSVTGNLEQQMLARFNNTQRLYPKDRTVVALFEEQAAETPHATAVVYDAGKLTYEELNTLANQFADYLRKQWNITTDDLVSIRLDRSHMMLVVILGIFKSGGAYVPVDPEYPEDRISYIVGNSRCKVVVDDALLAGFMATRDEYAKGNSTLKPGPRDLSYVIYTSGSTGKPKGVMIEHMGMLNHLFSKIDVLGLHAGSVVIQNASQSFDISVWQFLAALICGGTVIVYDKDLVLNIGAFIASLQRDKPTILEVVPSYLSAMLDQLEDNGDLHPLDTLTYMVVTGEELKPGLATRWFNLFPGRPLVNAYGPTEASDDIAHHVMYHMDGASRVPIGKTVQNLRIYIVNDDMQLCPAGVKGEICVSGDGIGRGYLYNEEKTRAAFMTDPFRDEQDVRMYRTGDIGRYLVDGNIAFYGRRDDQVKILGNRIELGEIESALQRHPAVDMAAVIVHVSGAGQELAAFFTSRGELETAALRAHLSNSLPAYMVPAYFVQLKTMPLTPNGKTDRKKLQELEITTMRSPVSYIPPRNKTEEQLLLIWQELAGHQGMGIKDNFFEVGGDSLKATRLSSRIHKTFGVKLPLRLLFTVATVEEQAALISQSSATTFYAIPQVPQQEYYPVSPSQQRIWVLSQFGEANIAYNVPGACIFSGKLDHEALNTAIRMLTDRHEILRTTFTEDPDGNIVQRILPIDRTGIRMNSHDLRHADEQRQLLERWMIQEHTAPFDLAEGPLMRISLYQLAGDQWVFSYVLHHIITDGWSTGILINELLQCYNALVNQEPVALQPLEIQYKDYAAWQLDLVKGQGAAAHRNYWLQQLSGELPVIGLQTDYPRPPVKTYSGSIVQKTFSATWLSRLKSISRAADATLFMGLLAALKMLLHRYTAQDDMIIGTPVAGREHADLEEQIGVYINTLALRTRFRNDDTFSDLLAQVRQVTLDAFEHQVYPFDELVDALQPPRDTSRSPIFDVMMILQNADADHNRETRRLHNLTVNAWPSGEQAVTKFDLTFVFVEAGEELLLSVEYRDDIYTQHTVSRLVQHLEQLVMAATDQPLWPLQLLSYMAAEERKELQEDTESIPSIDTPLSITAAFLAQVKKMPDQTALVCGDVSLTYSALYAKATQLAARLQDKYHLSPEELVVLKLPRNEWMVISILGVLLAGGAYIPVDPDYPAERVAYVLADSGSRILLDEALLAELKALPDNNGLAYTPAVIAPGNLAYVIYTSGSTGNPKGVMIEHRNVMSFFRNMRPRFFLEPDLVMGATTGYTFDISVLELIGTLVSGIRTVLIPEKDPVQILQYISSGRVNALQVTPSRLMQLLETDPGAINVLGLLKVLLVGGEAMSPYLYSILRSLHATQVVNVYGPTETTIWSSSLHINNAAALSVGKPLVNEQILILDSRQQLTPSGIAGEICIAGEGVARGYLNRPELTTERFVAHPFREGQRIYRTGDLGRRLPDGNISFIGRNDDQVKIRGYRIEPGEIAAALQRYPDINSTLVLVRPAASGEPQLVAFITAATVLNVTDIRIFLSQFLPAYMLPDQYIQLESFPLTPNGKTDRKALLNMAVSQMDTGTAYEPPGNATEEALVRIWEQLLNREKIGIRDNFFTLGGNSLTAVRVLSMIRKDLEVDIRIEEAFSNTTIAALAEEITRRKWAARRENTVSEGNITVTI